MTGTFHTSTHAKLFIYEWDGLNKWVQAATSVNRATSEAPSFFIFKRLFSNEEILEAVTGPFQCFFEQKLSTYAAIANLRLSLVAEDSKDTERSPLLVPIPKKISLSELDLIQKKVDEISQLHFEQWEQLSLNWSTHLIGQLDSCKVLLSEMEMKEFQERIPGFELRRRFIDLNLKMPTYERFDFECYWRFKTYLAIHSSLSRYHESSDPSHIQAFLKKMELDFQKILFETQRLSNIQQEETQSILKTLSVHDLKA